MIKKSIFLLVVLLVVSCQKKEKVNDFSFVTKVESYTYNQLKPLLYKNDDKVYVVNFWATWCAPCVKELPYFEQLGEVYKDRNVELILVSLDFPKQVEKRLIPFINNNKLQSKVVLLDDVNEDVWIKAIDSTWTGAIPATLIYSKEKRRFFEQSFDYKSLENEIQKFIN